MKKLLIFALCVAVLFVLVACEKTPTQSDLSDLQSDLSALQDKNAQLESDLATLKNQIPESKLPDLEDCEIGYQLEVYPKVAFDYKISEDCVVHIESITATLTAKNVIGAGDTIESPFYPFEVIILVTGSVGENNSSKTIRIYLYPNTTVGAYGTVNNNGTFSATIKTVAIENNIELYFSRCELS